MYTWITNHPELMAGLVWPFVSAMLSSGLNALSSHPKSKAVADVFAALGIDGPKAVDALQRVFTKAPPAEGPK